MITAACYGSGDGDESDNNENKVCSLFKNDVGGSRIRSRARSHDFRSHDHGVTIAFLFGVISDKQIIVKKLFSIR